MKILNKIDFKYTTKQTDIEQSKHFADAWMVKNQNTYKYRNQVNPQAIKEQILCSKLAEVAAANYISETYGLQTYPDFEIYDVAQKNWNPDLKADDLNFAVKSCKKDRASYTFQYKNGTDIEYFDVTGQEAPDRSKIYTIFLDFEHDMSCFNVLFLIRNDFLNKVNAWSYPFLPQFKQEKRVLYIHQKDIVDKKGDSLEYLYEVWGQKSDSQIESYIYKKVQPPKTA